MAKADVLDILRTKQMDPLEFHFDNLWIYPMNYYLSQADVDALHKIATSARLSSQIKKKYKMIDDIMIARGFKRFSAGTNRVIYRYYEDDRFLVKIAVDKVGMQDNPLEYKNQFLLKPFVAKTFYVSQCGTVAFSERVIPVKNVLEFKEIASDVFDILINKILGLYVVEDVGTEYFMNWGIRPGFGPVLLDYPYVYDLDGDKLFCSAVNPDTGIPCNGEIDYDEGFNHLICNRCRKIYLATDLRNKSADNKIIIKRGGSQMRIVIKKGDQVISEPVPMDDVMKMPARKPMKYNFAVTINRPNKPDNIAKEPIKEDKQKEHNTANVESGDVEDKKKNFFDNYDKNSATFIPDPDKKDSHNISDSDSTTACCTSNNTDDGNTTTHFEHNNLPSEACCSSNNTENISEESVEEDKSTDKNGDHDVNTESIDSTELEQNSPNNDDNSTVQEADTPSNDNEVNSPDYYAIRGVTGSYNQDTPMYAGDGQTTQFKRRGSKRQRDENGRFVSSNGGKSSNGYKKKGHNKTTDDDDQ